jgi:hypothetical protein
MAWVDMRRQFQINRITPGAVDMIGPNDIVLGAMSLLLSLTLRLMRVLSV